MSTWKVLAGSLKALPTVGWSRLHLVTSIVVTGFAVVVIVSWPGTASGGTPNSLVSKETASLLWLRSKTSTVTNPASSIDQLPVLVIKICGAMSRHLIRRFGVQAQSRG